MKIAFVGKGGSGKSSVSWLAVKTLEASNFHVLAIDADHNMDLTSNLGADPEKTPLMHKTDREFMQAVGLVSNNDFTQLLFKDSSTLPSFSVYPMDSYTKTISHPISQNISLINVGLGSPEILFQTKCAHGLSGPLKFYLGMLNENNNAVIIDSIAGTDMLNYGLYAGIDAVIGVVEPHRNSVKVFEQIQAICQKTLIPCYAIINKPTKNDFYADFVEKNKHHILGEIPFDEEIMNYNYTSLKKETKDSMKAILDQIFTFKKRGNLTSIKHFQDKKSGSFSV